MSNLSTSRSITFVDVETTHLDPKRSAILSITIIVDREGQTKTTWTTKIKPREVEIKFADKRALQICGYNEEAWQDAPSFEDVAKKISDLAWGPVVGHNISFDIDHLTAAFQRRGWEPLGRKENYLNSEKKYKFGYPLIDTCALAFLFLDTDRQNLNALREYLGIDTDRAHDSLTDTEDCREVFYNILNKTLDTASSGA